MSLRDKYLAQKQKLENLCNEHNLSYRLEMNTPKATLTLRPLQGMYEQISMLEIGRGTRLNSSHQQVSRMPASA